MLKRVQKGPFIYKNLPKKLKNISEKKIIRIYNRSVTIYPELLGKIVEIYNGKKFISLFIDKKKLGQKIGRFSLTKK